MRRAQRGAAVLLIAAALVALAAAVGLTLDTGHVTLNKSWLQTSVDAAALAAAKTLDDTMGDTTAATAAANSLMSSNAGTNREMQDALSSGDLQIAVQFSATLQPFTPGTAPANYARVVASNFTMWNGLTSLVGVTDIETAASAIAGPSPTIDNACNVAPVMVCGDASAGAPFWGYQENVLDVLKTASGNGGNFEVGPGNFQLIRLGDGQGGADVRRNMAGDFAGCIEAEDDIETEPGNTVGPSAQGLNTRFGQYQGPVSAADYPPDVVVREPSPNLTYDPASDTIRQGGSTVTFGDDIDYSFEDYTADVSSGNFTHPPPNGGIGAFDRRVLTVPIGDCSSTTNGQGTVPLLGFGCYYLIQPVQQQGQNAYIYGQFIDGCEAGGTPGPNPGSGPGPYVIQLYRDYNSGDS